MNPAITAALVAAQQSGELADVVGRLIRAGAVSIATAVAFESRSEAEAKQREELIGKGLVRRRGDGRLFVNQRAVDERDARIGYVFIMGLFVFLSVAASAIALAAFA